MRLNERFVDTAVAAHEDDDVEVIHLSHGDRVIDGHVNHVEIAASEACPLLTRISVETNRR